MGLEHLSKKDLIEVLEIVESAQACRSAEQMKQLILRAKDLVCADFTICGMINLCGETPNKIVKVVNGNYPTEWLTHYLSERFYFSDPVVKSLARFSMTRLWSEIYKEFDDESSSRVINCASDHGLKYGISTGIFLPERNNLAIFTFSGDRNRFNSRHKELIDFLALHLNSSLLRISDEMIPVLEAQTKTGYGIMI